MDLEQITKNSSIEEKTKFYELVKGNVCANYEWGFYYLPSEHSRKSPAYQNVKVPFNLVDNQGDLVSDLDKSLDFLYTLTYDSAKKYFSIVESANKKSGLRKK